MAGKVLSGKSKSKIKHQRALEKKKHYCCALTYITMELL